MCIIGKRELASFSPNDIREPKYSIHEQSQESQKLELKKMNEDNTNVVKKENECSKNSEPVVNYLMMIKC